MTLRRMQGGRAAGRHPIISCQPIADVATGALVGVEALTRLVGPPTQPPDVCPRETETNGRRAPLSLATVEAALARIHELRPPAFLAFSLTPDAIVVREIQELLPAGATDRIVLALAEPARATASPGLRTALRHVRAQGVRLAVDATGAGCPSLGHILGPLVDLAPDLIQVDPHFTARVAVDPVRAAQGGALVRFAGAIGAKVIAAGVETTDQLKSVRELGIPFAQGDLVARPAPLTRLPQRYLHITRNRGWAA